MATFSQGFSNTFRALDGARQWRSAQGENQRQFDATLGENQRQFDETAAQQGALNQSTINLREIQGRELEEVIKNLGQAREQSAEKHPLEMNRTRALTGLTNAQTGATQENTRGARLANNLREETHDSLVDSTRAQNRANEHVSKRLVYDSRNDLATNLQQATSDENGRQLSPEEIVNDPERLAAFAGIVTQASDMVDIDFGIGENDYATTYPVDVNDPSKGYYLLKSEGGKSKIDPIVGEDGQPVVISTEEMAEYVREAQQQLDQKASAGGGGSTRQRQLDQQAHDTAVQQVGPAPRDPGVSAEGLDLNQLQGEYDALEQEHQQLVRQMDEMPSGRGRARNRDVPLEAMTPVQRERAQQFDALDQRREQVERQLGDISGNLMQARTAGRYQEESENYQRRLGERTDQNINRVNQHDALGRTLSGPEQSANLMRTGLAGVSASDVQAQQNERLAAAQDQIRKDLSFVVTTDRNQDRKVVKDQDMGNRLANQLQSLATNPDTQGPWNAALERGMMPAIIQSAIDLSGNDPSRVSLQAGLTAMMSGVSTRDVGKVMDYVSRLAADRGGEMSPDQYRQFTERAAEVVSNRADNNPVTDKDARALAQDVLIEQRSRRTLGE